jgi:glycosyltransferase involved in cell wall biosynthesis
VELVSVLIPCRNAAPWLEQALRSALDQTWPRLEIIVVDDGSTDGSFELARRFASARCHVVRREARGASAARNHALRLAQGDFIQYLDADDFLAADKISLQIEAMRRGVPGSLSWSSATYLLAGTDTGVRHFETARPAGASAADFLARLWGGEGEPGMVLVHQWLVPRALLDHAGPWNESLSIDDDGEFFARVMLASTGRILVPEAQCFYRKFHSHTHLSARARDSSHRRSAVEAACLKAGHLLARAPADHVARRAVSRLLTQQIVDAYPDPVYRRGIAFLRRHDLPFAPEFEAPPWFLHANPLLGWKAARLLQDGARVCRRIVSDVAAVCDRRSNSGGNQ